MSQYSAGSSRQSGARSQQRIRGGAQLPASDAASAASRTYHPQDDAQYGYDQAASSSNAFNPDSEQLFDQSHATSHDPYADPEYTDQQPAYDPDANPFEQPHYSDTAVDANGAPYAEVDLSPEPIPEDVFRRSKLSLYLTYFFSAWGDRMWEFSVIIFLIDLYPTTLFYSSFFGLVENITAILAGPAIGRWIDTSDRLATVRWTIIGQNCSICAASIVFYMVLRAIESAAAAGGDISTGSASRAAVSYLFILVMGAVAEVASIGAKVAIHKDWVVVVAGPGDVESGVNDRLTQLNSNMRRIDLCCSILAPLLVGVISSLASSSAAVLFVAIWSATSLGVEYKLVGWVYDNIPALHGKEATAAAAAAAGQTPGGINASLASASSRVASLTDISRPLDRFAMSGLAAMEQIRVFFVRFVATMRAYRAHPVFRASFAYALLYCSVLSMGGIMSAWLKLRDVSNAVIAIVRGLAAFVGIVATYAVPHMVKRWGLLQAGLIATWAQVLMLLPVAFSFVYYFQSVTTQLVMLFVFLCLSRFGLWSFDLCETQIMQESIAASEAGLLNGAQESAINVFYIGSFLMTIIFSDPSLFAAPAWISFLCVIVAAICYTNYASDQLQTDNPFPALETFKLHKKVEYAPTAMDSPQPPVEQQFQTQQEAGYDAAVEAAVGQVDETAYEDYPPQQAPSYDRPYDDEEETAY